MPSKLRIVREPAPWSPSRDVDLIGTVWKKGGEVGFLTYFSRTAELQYSGAVLVSMLGGGHYRAYYNSGLSSTRMLDELRYQLLEDGWVASDAILNVLDQPQPVRSP